MLLPLLLYTRLHRSTLLENAARARLHERIAGAPGVHLRALDQEVGLGLGATRHHLAHLVRHGLVQAVRLGGRLRYFPAGAAPGEASPAPCAAEALRAVADLDAREPGLSVRKAASRLGLSPSAVHRARAKLAGRRP